MINNDFFILQPHSQRNLCFLYQDDVRNIKRGIWERQVATISFIIFWDFWMIYQTFLSPQVKRWAIITYKHGEYELADELPNDLRLTT